MKIQAFDGKIRLEEIKIDHIEYPELQKAINPYYSKKGVKLDGYEAGMVQTKKFEQTFVNEYLAWNLHDEDVMKLGIKEGMKQGIVETAKKFLALGLPIETIKEGTGLSEEEIKALQ